MHALHELFEKIASFVSGGASITVAELRACLSSRISYLDYRQQMIKQKFIDSQGRLQSPFVNGLSQEERVLLEFLVTFQPRALLYLIDPSLELVRFLGQGEIAKVYLIRKDGLEYALKVMKKSKSFFVFGTP